MKKPSVVSFLITLLLAAAVCIQGSEPVKDTDGNPVSDRNQYFIQPANNNGGGLVPAAINILPFCPLGITQTLLPYQPGVPVGFQLPYGANPIVNTSFPLNIEFRSKVWPVCTEFSKFWKFDDSPSASEERAILIGGERFGKDSEFKIEKAGEGAGANTYKLTTSYGTVGAIPGGWMGALQLIVTKDTTKTLPIKFKKVDAATTTSTSRVEKLGLRMFPFY
ncbi:PREDICTED: cysteine protease inhibitor WSCP-like [Camelina sativa]|uniref:Cysteine protease inhibitor WSCP-like n=1 Tax=Camelina sativa TaxID=90675 RepID=A0ABM0TLE9_CAMSA|nr:PREDICTED: cysteine protease inhibitor WSCP-like [Camelina sativa]